MGQQSIASQFEDSEAFIRDEKNVNKKARSRFLRPKKANFRKKIEGKKQMYVVDDHI